MGDPCWLDQSVPEELHPVEGIHMQAVHEELKPVARTHTGEVREELSPVGGILHWRGGRPPLPEEEAAAETT